LTSDINLKEIENALYESIEKLSRINQREAQKSKKEARKEKKLKEKLKLFWAQREARKFWTPEMNRKECKTSVYRFYPTKDIEFR
jgi:hypothetical protein